MNSTFTITDINKSVDDLKKNMATVKAMIDGMKVTLTASHTIFIQLPIGKK